MGRDAKNEKSEEKHRLLVLVTVNLHIGLKIRDPPKEYLPLVRSASCRSFVSVRQRRLGEAVVVKVKESRQSGLLEGCRAREREREKDVNGRTLNGLQR